MSKIFRWLSVGVLSLVFSVGATLGQFDDPIFADDPLGDPTAPEDPIDLGNPTLPPGSEDPTLTPTDPTPPVDGEIPEEPVHDGPLVSDVHFADSDLEACITDLFQQSKTHGYAEDYTSISCINGDVDSLVGLEKFTSLTSIQIYGGNVTSLAPLSGLQELTEIELGGTPLQSTIGLAGLDKLNRLSLSGNQINDLGGLYNLPALKSLYLDENLIENISSLENVKSLETLSLGGNKIVDIDAISFLTELRELSFGFGSDVSDLSPLENLHNLGDLNVSNAKVTSVSDLSGLIQLRVLKIGGNQIQDIRPLQNLSNLVYLSLGNNDISDVNTLGQLTNLKWLWLSNNKITNIDEFSSLINLQDLALDGNEITDITSLNSLSNLGWVRLGDQVTLSCSDLDQFIASHPNVSITRPSECGVLPTNANVIKVAVIMAEPSDESFKKDKSYFENEIFPDVKDYWCEQSFGTRDENDVCSGGLVDLDFEVFDRDETNQKYKLHQTDEYYGDNAILGTYNILFAENEALHFSDKQRRFEFVRDVLLLGDSAVDYETYDIAIVLHPGDGEGFLDLGDNMRSAMLTGIDVIKEFFPTDETVSAPVLLAENERMMVWAHEIGHVIGYLKNGQSLMDLYPENTSGRYSGKIGDAGIMSSVSKAVALTSFSKVDLGWLVFDNIQFGITEIESLSTMEYKDKVKKLSLPNEEYYFLEARTKDPKYSRWDSNSIKENVLITYKVTSLLLESGSTIPFVNIAHIEKIDADFGENPYIDPINSILIRNGGAFATEHNYSIYAEVNIKNTAVKDKKGVTLNPTVQIAKSEWASDLMIQDVEVGPSDGGMGIGAYWEQEKLLQNKYSKIDKDGLILILTLLLIIGLGFIGFRVYKKEKKTKLHILLGVLVLLVIAFFYRILLLGVMNIPISVTHGIKMILGVEGKYVDCIGLVDEKGYTILLDEWIPSNECKDRKGTPRPKGITIQDAPTSGTTSPDIDLHAITPEGLHVGMNYETGEYEKEIPDVIASGDLLYDDEWIFVPEDIEIEYYVSSHDIEEYFAANPEVSEQLDSLKEGFSLQAIKYDEDGTRHESPLLENETIAPGVEAPYVFSGSGSTIEIVPVNDAPLFDFLTPTEETETVDKSFDITWVDFDEEDDATIQLYYDTDDSGVDGTLITADVFSEDDETDQWTWNTTDVPEGDYFLYAVIDDGVNDPLTVYSDYALDIDHNKKIKATVWINPKKLNVKSKGKFVKGFIELPNGLDVNNINLKKVRMVVNGKRIKADRTKSKIGDQNKNGIPDLMVQFERSAVQDIVELGKNRVKIRGKIDGQVFRDRTSLEVIGKKKKQKNKWWKKWPHKKVKSHKPTPKNNASMIR